jgi:Right handed beta helix region
MRRTSILTGSGLAVLAAAALTIGGPLNPPSGPVASTYKTLSEVEPRIAVNAANTPGDAYALLKITQPGSYYLTGNLTGVAGKSTIQIASDHVTLDLGGFAINGGSQGVNVFAAPPATWANIIIRNGSITGCPNGGVSAASTDGAVLRDLTVYSCPGNGIDAGSGARIEHCTAEYCGGVGISGFLSARIRDCQANHNGASGFEVRAGGTLDDSTASYNGFRGANVWAEVTMRNCKIIHNGENGIDALDGCVIESCVVQGNLGTGVNVGGASAVTGCTVETNGQFGIAIGSGRVTDCTVASNGTAVLFGIGIGTNGPGGTRIEGNTIMNHHTGIMPVSGGCVIIRNDSYNNVVFVGPVGAINSVGPTINNAGAITNTNPWANFVR